MSKKRDYSDFINFAKKNKDLPRTKIIEEFRKQGGEVQKKKGLEIIRDIFSIQKGEQRSKTVREIFSTKKKNSYFSVEGNTKNGKPKVWSRENESIRELYDKVSELYNVKTNSFMTININVNSDDYTSNNYFQIFVPYNQRKKQGAKSVGNQILQTIQTYYKNLAKMYSYKENKCEDVVYLSQRAKTYLNKQKYLSFDEVKNILNDYGFSVNKIDLVNFKD